MESKVSFKNISILLGCFLVGFFSHMFFIHKEDIDIFFLLNPPQEVLVVEDMVEEDVKSVVCEPVIEEEKYDPCPIQVDISGAVKTPGVYCFQKESTVIDAVKKAKGFTSDAGFKYISMKINLATKLLDNTKIYMPFDTDYDCKLLTFNLPKDIIEIVTPPLQDPPQSSTDTPVQCISINNATSEQLQTLDGVGPSTAQKIIDGRPYEVLEDLLDVSGIGEITFNKFKDKICL